MILEKRVGKGRPFQQGRGQTVPHSVGAANRWVVRGRWAVRGTPRKVTGVPAPRTALSSAFVGEVADLRLRAKQATLAVMIKHIAWKGGLRPGL